VELPGGFKVAALAAVNAFGDVRDPSTGRIIAGARRSPDSMEFVDTSRGMKMRAVQPPPSRENTTLVVVATNAALTKVEANKLAQLGSLGMARSIDPVNTMHDGDLVIALSTGEKRSSMDALGTAAAEAVGEAIVRAVRMAPTLGGVRGLKKS
jgi:L-aminopeptidase/D-esterase-like protein